MAFAPDALTVLGGYPGNAEKAVAAFATLDRNKLVEDFVAAPGALERRLHQIVTLAPYDSRRTVFYRHTSLLWDWGTGHEIFNKNGRKYLSGRHPGRMRRQRQQRQHQGARGGTDAHHHHGVGWFAA
jgi:hypothetical protein